MKEKRNNFNYLLITMPYTEYSLKEKKNTAELHLFASKPYLDGHCSSQAVSICGKMQLNDEINNIFNCQSEESARVKCAVVGRRVCGICVSHLYANY